MSDRRLIVWAFIGVIAASELQGSYGLAICGWLRSNDQPEACPEVLNALHANRESLIAGVLGLLAGFSSNVGGAP